MAAIVAEVEALFGRDVGVAQRAAERVARVLERAPITAVVGLDRALRDGGLHRRLGRDFVEVRAYQVARLDRLERGQTAALGVASLVRDGHAREAAVERLAGRRERLAVAFLINRVGDYVGAVGARAWAALEDLLVPASASHVVAALPLIERMRGLARAGDARERRLLAFFESRDPRVVAALWEGVRGGEPAVARGAARLLLARHPGEAETQALYEAALGSKALPLRVWAARAVADRRATPAAVAAAIAPRLAEDGAKAVRVCGVAAAARLGDLVALRRAAFDRNGEVRHQARVQLASLGAALDYRGLALATLAGAGVRRDEAIGALATLSDFGRGEDRAAIARFVGDPRPSVAREAARTLAIVDRI